ncbi:hypothetical protein [Marinobacter sp. X15-166B]|uniref:hypothetical protein n=1 Tax=Marinobacter sp. X15-166B TaxID=1897620 RepID=UPI00085CD247|nr:hypothetical protein [Marinobacter sp. X15-166B]OEY67019.1 hypothetical protein BG841_11500 [Marinobacter sp. X15-166B]
MNSWQECLSPQCQVVLQRTREQVVQRGGYAITVEDFLLMLIEYDPEIPRFLRVRGVDLDELIRTIQCEQPIVTAVDGESGLSSQLQYWFATAREASEAPALDWSELFEALVRRADRLQNKAYVSVLEQITDWAALPGICPGAAAGLPSAQPVVVTDPRWLALSEDIAVLLSANPQALVWLKGDRGSGKTTWLHTLVPSLDAGFLWLDLRTETEVMGRLEQTCLPRESDPAPVLILDNTSPADLEQILQLPDSIARLLLSYHGPVLLISPQTADDSNAGRLLERRLGRALDVVNMPPSSPGQIHAVVTSHQSAIEKRWQVEVTAETLHYVAFGQPGFCTSPGMALQWLERACARLALAVERTPLESQCLGGEIDSLRRQILIRLARNEPVAALEETLAELASQRAAIDTQWSARKARGESRRLAVADLERERQCWTTT